MLPRAARLPPQSVRLLCPYFLCTQVLNLNTCHILLVLIACLRHYLRGHGIASQLSRCVHGKYFVHLPILQKHPSTNLCVRRFERVTLLGNPVALLHHAVELLLIGCDETALDFVERVFHLLVTTANRDIRASGTNTDVRACTHTARFTQHRQCERNTNLLRNRHCPLDGIIT